MKTKHTKGEWMIDSANLTTVYSDDNGSNVADCNTQRPIEENVCNAKLIAAAPELLEALQNLLAWANIKEGSPSQHLADAANAAIKKATE